MSVELAYRETGDGPPLLVMHGVFGSGTNWRSITKALAADRRVFTLDLRNHGSSPHAEHMDYRSMAEDVGAFMERQGLERAALLGHSMGGKTAMQLALSAPGRVECLIVVDIAPVTTEEDHAPYIAAMQNMDLEHLTRRSDAEAELAAVIPEPGARSFLLQNLVNEGGRFRWRLNLDAIEACLPELADFPDPAVDAQYTGPTLFVRGATSSYVRGEHAALIERLFPRAEIRSVDGAGHWVHVDKPREFLALVRDFLARHAST
ncbi:MAG: alpha/beta fold hydrolase [Gammaproteobacteria bacterium]|nr:alpha/beta fold hydrolase [Gammaproteobacteria bacterium]